MRFYVLLKIINFCIVGVLTNGHDMNRNKPLILVQNEEQEVFEFPTQIYRDETTNEFTYKNFPSQKMLYFCPAETANERLAVDKNKKLENCLFGSEMVKNFCSQEVKPIIREALNKEGNHIKCSFGNSSGFLYNFGYQYCVMQTENIEENFVKIYSFCHQFERTLYIQHEIYSPALLKNDVFMKNNELWLRENEYDEYDLFNQNQDFRNRAVGMQVLHLYFDKIRDCEPIFKGALVSPFDMAFAPWKRPFFHYANVVTIHVDLYKIWHYINFYIEEAAIQLLGQITIYSGIYPEIPMEIMEQEVQDYSSSLKNLIPSVLWKLVYNAKRTAAIAIIVHNLPIKQKPYRKLCEENICSGNNWNNREEDFPNFKDHVYCCKAEVITKLLRTQQVEVNDLKQEPKLVDDDKFNSVVDDLKLEQKLFVDDKFSSYLHRLNQIL